VAQTFETECRENAAEMAADPTLREMSRDWIVATAPFKYTYNFSWMGRPVIQFPQDLLAMQEIIWHTKPDLIVETGIAHGGSIVFYASMLELLGGRGSVIGIDLEIRPHNRAAIESHPMARRITMVEGSSTDERTVRRVQELARGYDRVLVALDSNHTHDHVLRELELYSPLVQCASSSRRTIASSSTRTSRTSSSSASHPAAISDAFATDIRDRRSGTPGPDSRIGSVDH
jgi:cephalosporin hydroxylase